MKQPHLFEVTWCELVKEGNAQGQSLTCWNTHTDKKEAMKDLRFVLKQAERKSTVRGLGTVYDVTFKSHY